MMMDKIHKVIMEYLKNVTPAQLERDLENSGIEECPDKFTFRIEGEPMIFLDQSLIIDTLKLPDILRYETIDIKPLTINLAETTYAPCLQDSQYVIKKVA